MGLLIMTNAPFYMIYYYVINYLLGHLKTLYKAIV